MLQKIDAERIFQRIIEQYEYGQQKEVLFLELVRRLNLNIHKPLGEQIELLLGRKLTSAENEKIDTLNFCAITG